MNSLKFTTLSIIMILFYGNTKAQDDFYPSSNSKKNIKSEIIREAKAIEDRVSEDEYSTATDYAVEKRQQEYEQAYNEQMGITDSTTYYEDENGNVRITNNYYTGDNYDYDNEYYDYEYSSRIKRFRTSNRSRYGYYDDYYTNYYWYDYNPNYYGTSIYSSYSWWNPRPWGNIGWSYYGGWNVGWNWGWGWSGNYGYYGSSCYGWNSYYSPNYWGGHHHHGYNDYYASNYYNSYDHNSNYYGKRGGSSNSSGYGGRNPSSTSGYGGNSGKSFGQKYEAAVKNDNPRGSYSSSSKPLNTGNPRANSSVVNNNSGVKNNSYSTPRTTSTSSTPIKNNGYSSPRTTTKSSSETFKPNNNNKPSYSNPSGNSKPNYSKPRTTYNKPKTTYSAPSVKPRQSQPSYSKPSGGSYNRGSSNGGTRSSGSVGGPRKR